MIDGIIQLDAKDYGTRVLWDKLRGGYRGRGIDQTIIGDGSSGGFTLTGPVESLHLSDLTINGTFRNRHGNYTESYRNVTCERVKFFATGAFNALHLVLDNLSGMAENWTFTDCVFQSTGRMGAEIQNHNAGDVLRYRNITFIRPRFENSAQQGLSFTGKGEDCYVEGAVCDGNGSYGLENVGCDRLRVNGLDLRNIPAGVRAISYSNTRPMADCSLERVTGTIPERLYFENTQRLTIRDSALIREGADGPLLEFNGNGNADTTLDGGYYEQRTDGRIATYVDCAGHHAVNGVRARSVFSPRTQTLFGIGGQGHLDVNGDSVIEAIGGVDLFGASGGATLDVSPEARQVQV